MWKTTVWKELHCWKLVLPMKKKKKWKVVLSGPHKAELYKKSDCSRKLSCQPIKGKTIWYPLSATLELLGLPHLHNQTEREVFHCSIPCLIDYSNKSKFWLMSDLKALFLIDKVRWASNNYLAIQLLTIVASFYFFSMWNI